MASPYVGLYDDAGTRSSFFRIVGNKKLGFKCFLNKNSAEFSYKIQQGLAKDDMAPRVYGEVGRIRYGGELTDWGYLTEVAKPMAVCCEEDCDGDCYDSDCSNSVDIQSTVWVLNNYHGLSYVDAHRANFGWIRRKNMSMLVPIDFGIESFNGIDENIWGEIDWDGLAAENTCNCTECRRYDYA